MSHTFTDCIHQSTHPTSSFTHCPLFSSLSLGRAGSVVVRLSNTQAVCSVGNVNSKQCTSVYVWASIIWSRGRRRSIQSYKVLVKGNSPNTNWMTTAEMESVGTGEPPQIIKGALPCLTPWESKTTHQLLMLRWVLVYSGRNSRKMEIWSVFTAECANSENDDLSLAKE